MKGLVFHDSCGGVSTEFITVHKKWCVQIGDSKYHINDEQTTFTYRSPKIIFEVSACDGSCQVFEEIPDDVLEKALSQIKTMVDKKA